jgi:hypothetical protein
LLTGASADEGDAQRRRLRWDDAQDVLRQLEGVESGEAARTTAN